MERIIDRLDKYLKANSINDNMATEILGLSVGTISKSRKDGRDFSSKNAEKALNVFQDLDRVWLLTGEGSMLKGEVPALTDEDYLPRITDNPNEGRPYYDVDFLGGYGEQEDAIGLVSNYNIDYKPFNRSGVFYSNLYGDSMYPEFHSGAVLAMRPVEGWQDFLVLGKVYAIITKGGQRTVKKLAKGEDNDSYTLVPINKDYDTQQIPKSAILAVYEVLGGINRYE